MGRLPPAVSEPAARCQGIDRFPCRAGGQIGLPREGHGTGIISRPAAMTRPSSASTHRSRGRFGWRIAYFGAAQAADIKVLSAGALRFANAGARGRFRGGYPAKPFAARLRHRRRGSSSASPRGEPVDVAILTEPRHQDARRRRQDRVKRAFALIGRGRDRSSRQKGACRIPISVRWPGSGGTLLVARSVRLHRPGERRHPAAYTSRKYSRRLGNCGRFEREAAADFRQRRGNRH